MCISEDLEEIFLKVYNQKYTLIGVIEHYITSHDDFGGIFIYCHKCDTEWHLLLIQAIRCFVSCLNLSNINYVQYVMNINVV